MSTRSDRTSTAADLETGRSALLPGDGQESSSLAVVGCGRVFEHCYWPALQRTRKWRLVGACDPLESRRDWISARAPGIRVCGRVEELLQEQAADAMLICTPPDEHGELAIFGLRHGLHILVEKPVARSMPEYRAAQQAAQEARRLLAGAWSRRFRGPYIALAKSIQRLPRQSIQRMRFELAFPVAQWGAVTGYLGEPARGGGVVDDVASHQVDLLNWMLRGEPLEVMVRTHAQSGNGLGRLEYRMRYPPNLDIECVAEHSRQYCEELKVYTDRGVLASFPTGTIRLPTTFQVVLPLISRLHGPLDRRIRQLAGRADVTVQSFMGMLEAFRQDVSSWQREGSTSLHVGSDTATMAVLDALRRAAVRQGKWEPTSLSS